MQADGIPLAAGKTIIIENGNRHGTGAAGRRNRGGTGIFDCFWMIFAIKIIHYTQPHPKKQDLPERAALQKVPVGESGRPGWRRELSLAGVRLPGAMRPRQAAAKPGPQGSAALFQEVGGNEIDRHLAAQEADHFL